MSAPFKYYFSNKRFFKEKSGVLIRYSRKVLIKYFTSKKVRFQVNTGYIYDTK